jgi:hypothetical protein
MFLLYIITRILLLATQISASDIQFIKAELYNPLIKRRQDSSFSTQLLNEQDLWEFAIKVKIGTPAKEFSLLFDTGSSDTWIPSVNCSEQDGCPSFMNHFDSSESSTFKQLDQDFHINYDASESKGKYFIDAMTLNGHSIPDQVLSLVDHSFGPLSAQQRVDNSADNIYLDGVMGAGLATSTMRYQQGGSLYYPFPIHLYKKGIVSKPIFSVFMNDQDRGQVLFGAAPGHHKMMYTDLSPGTNTHWSVQVTSVEFQNETYSLNFDFSGQTNFLVDTGTNFMYLPKKMALELAHLIDPNVEVLEDNRLVVDCKYQSTPDMINFSFPKSKHASQDPILKIPLSDLVAERKEDGNCFLLFIPSDNKAVFGNMLLRKLVTVFDFGEHRIGFSYNGNSDVNGETASDDE